MAVWSRLVRDRTVARLRTSARARIAIAGSLALGLATAGCALVGGLDDYYVATAGGAVDASVASDAEPSTEASSPDAAARASCPQPTFNCGPGADQDCCSSRVVPAGTFKRSYDGIAGAGYEDDAFPATVGTFALDTYEITVGRFRQFVNAYPGSAPAPGSGKNSKDPTDEGWRAAWSANLPTDAAALAASLACHAQAPWTNVPGENETRPIACISWFEALAFCTWDGGRLPTEAEWNFAAAGGDEQRVYPWSSPPSSTTLAPALSVYGVPKSEPVGSRSPAGDARWGHSDLSGNLWEWTLDADLPYRVPCVDCGGGDDVERSVRGGCYGCLLEDLRVSPRGSGNATGRKVDRGARCARKAE